jgi:hypothetical protein
MEVSEQILRVLKEKDQAIKSGTKAMLGILEELRAQVMTDLGKTTLTDWDRYYLQQTFRSIQSQVANFEAKARAEASGLFDQSWDLGKNLVDASLGVTGIYTGFHLSSSVLDTLKEYSNDYLQNLFGDAWTKIKGEINLGVLGQKTPQEVAQAIGETIDSGRFANFANRAETITQTEMGRVFSAATQARMEQAADYVDGLEKMWRHVGHPMVPRLTHLAADGDHVPVDQPFNIGGVLMMHPRDPAAPLDEVINCG